MSKPSWELRRHGDRIERKWAKVIGSNFSNYERLWVEHVVPLTYRVSGDPSCILLRPEVPDPLKALATANYNVCQHLVWCHEQLEHSRPSISSRAGLYSFYSHLYSAGGAAIGFLRAVNNVILAYGGAPISDKENHLGRYDKDLPRRFKEAFDERTKAYRRPQVHAWGFPIIGRRIPTRTTVAKWKDLGDLAAYLRKPGLKKRLATEFVDARRQARDDLEFFEQTLDGVWDLAIRELATQLKDSARYSANQKVGSGVSAPSPVRGLNMTLVWSGSSVVTSVP